MTPAEVEAFVHAMIISNGNSYFDIGFELAYETATFKRARVALQAASIKYVKNIIYGITPDATMVAVRCGDVIKMESYSLKALR